MPVQSARYAAWVKRVERLPWVRRLYPGENLPCDGIKWGTVALRDLYPWGPGLSRPARGIQAKSKCSRRAQWHFRAKGEKSPGTTPRVSHRHRSGNYCLSHLISEGFGSMEEEARADKWFREHPEPGSEENGDE